MCRRVAIELDNVYICIRCSAKVAKNDVGRIIITTRDEGRVRLLLL